MKKILRITVFAVLMAPMSLLADEGMWLLNMMERMNYKDMQKCGVKLTAEQIYSINNSSLKDAIGWFSNGCTSEIVSEKGLVLTNHHCGYDAIAGLSTPKDNILDNGFWAKSMAEERPAPGVTLALVNKIVDITAEVMDSVKGMNVTDRNNALARIYGHITKRAIEGNHYEAQCRSMFEGNAYYLFIFERFTDVRLVGTPPQNIGKFGGETDNWMWPRHTGDFSMFRVYADKDGKPAKYAETNIPYKPKTFLKVSKEGVKKGDYAMIIGFPGRTNRYMFSQGVQQATDLVDPTIVKLRDVRLNAWKEEMNKDVDVRLKLSSDYASVSNYWKYFKGEGQQLKSNKVYDKKLSEEKKFDKWAKGKPEYENVMRDVAKIYKAYEPYATQSWYWREGIISPTISKLAYYGLLMQEAIESGNQAKIDGLKKSLLNAVEDIPYESAMVRADQRILDSLLLIYMDNNEKSMRPAFFNEQIAKYGGGDYKAGVKAYVANAFATSIFADKNMFVAWVNNPRPELIKNDIMYLHVKAFKANYDDNFKGKIDSFNDQETELSRVYIKGLIEMNPKTNYYPDANSSIRLTYGQVKPYMNFEVMTYLDGVIEKHKKYSGNPEFDLPQNLIDAYNAKNFGSYTDKTGKVPVCFLTDNDITGGNSGSPVMDAEGRLIGLAFDGNWEAMSGNIHYEPSKQRTIVVDIRYVLWIIDKLGGASNLIEEMQIEG